jgi:hypothetical protein
MIAAQRHGIGCPQATSACPQGTGSAWTDRRACPRLISHERGTGWSARGLRRGCAGSPGWMPRSWTRGRCRRRINADARSSTRWPGGAPPSIGSGSLSIGPPICPIARRCAACSTCWPRVATVHWRSGDWSTSSPVRQCRRCSVRCAFGPAGVRSTSTCTPRPSGSTSSWAVPRSTSHRLIASATSGRDAALAAVGILVVRFTYQRLTREPDAVRREVLAILAARRVQAEAGSGDG